MCSHKYALSDKIGNDILRLEREKWKQSTESVSSTESSRRHNQINQVSRGNFHAVHSAYCYQRPHQSVGVFL